LLSICIPTKNRAAQLEQCLRAIFTAPSYDPQLIEVVVSDNASTDDTPRVVERFVAAGERLVFNRNSENLGIGAERNFVKALSIASGVLLRLINDYVILSDEALSAHVRFAREHAARRPSAVFLQDTRPGHKGTEEGTLDGMAYAAEWRLTWIGTHVYWKEAWDALPDKLQAISTCFMHLDWFIRLHDQSQPSYIVRGDFYRSIKPAGLGVDYDWFEIHQTKFLSLLRPLLASGQISRRTFNHIRYVLYKAMHHSFKDRCFKVVRESESVRRGVMRTFYRNYNDCWWFHLHFPPYVLKLYIKEWTGYWWMKRRVKGSR
ncbi:MAG: glycosyltransferase family 2 protein, partial [Bacteroidaceae bacterium]|nr:glycosyltransferase family 2 protein [Bacteroidaceae bacterium]